MGILQVLELEEFENDPEFWDMTFDEVDDAKLSPSIDNQNNTNRERCWDGYYS